MKKFAKVMSVVLAVMLVSVMFVGCVGSADKTAEKLEKKGYIVTNTPGLLKVESIVTGTKTEDGKIESVTVTYYKEVEDAKKAKEDADKAKKDSDDIVVKRSGKAVIVGTKKAVKVVS